MIEVYALTHINSIDPYFAFPPNNNKTQIIEGICSRLDLPGRFHLPVFYGEWSIASGVPHNSDWFKQMMDTQVYAYKQSAGFAFWTMKNFAVPNSLCGNGGSSYNCFEGRTWSFLSLIDEDVITATTFNETRNQQCNSSAMPGGNLTLMACVIVCIKLVIGKMYR